MKKKFLTIFLIFTGLFVANTCSADLPAPYNLSVSGVGEASVTFHWYHDTDSGDVQEFDLAYTEATTTENQDRTHLYLDLSNGVATTVNGTTTYFYSYTKRGLPSNTEYEWFVTAVAENTDNNSFTQEADTTFTTDTTQMPPEENPPNGNGSDTSSVNIGQTFQNVGNLQEAADKFMTFLVTVGFAVGPILIMYAGFVLMTKQGNPEAVNTAKQILLWTIVALSIMLFAKGVPAVIKDLF